MLLRDVVDLDFVFVSIILSEIGHLSLNVGKGLLHSVGTWIVALSGRVFV